MISPSLAYDAIISAYTGLDETITALTDDGIGELKSVLSDVRTTPKSWSEFLDVFVDDTELVARIKAK